MIAKSLNRYVLYVAWVQALIAMLASLYYSDIKHFTPCVLCWYQRILMYPLVLIIAVGILRKDRNLPYYALPMSILGLCISFYHVLLQRGILPESVAPCSIGASCVTKYAGYFGFITIPLMSFTAFLIITICIEVYRRQKR